MRRVRGGGRFACVLARARACVCVCVGESELGFFSHSCSREVKERKRERITRKKAQVSSERVDMRCSRVSAASANARLCADQLDDHEALRDLREKRVVGPAVLGTSSVRTLLKSMWPNLPHRVASLRSSTKCPMQSSTCSHIFACRRLAYLHMVGPHWTRTGPSQRELRAFLRPKVSYLL